MSTHDRTPADPAAATGTEANLARVHYLPAATSNEGLEGEVMTEAQYRAHLSQKEQALARYRGYRTDVVRVVRAVRTAATHRRTVSTTRAVVRNLAYPGLGVKVAWARWRDGHGGSRYERMMRSAEASGNMDALLEWEARATAEKARRHARVMDWLSSPLTLVKAGAVGLGSLVAALLALGLVVAVATEDFSSVLDPILGVIHAITALVWFVSAYGMLLVLGGTAVVVAALWQLGRSHSEIAQAGWLAADKADPATGVLVTADGIVRALQHLGIPALNKAFKAGWVPRFALTPTREGSGAFKGYRAIFELPDGVPPSMVADKREILASNLARNTMEVWPSDYGQEKGGKAAHVNLYVADAGIMDKPTPEYPLMHSGTADVFLGVPIGITQRGDTVLWPIYGSNFVFGGRPGQGKSNAMRVVFAGCALDPLTELRVHVFAGNGDFDAFEKRLSRYHKGASPEHAELATEHLRDLLAEVERRENRLADDCNAKKLTRAIAEAHPDLRPLVVGFSECHELFTDKICGQEAAELAIRVAKRGRKTGVSLGFDTQSSRAGAIPSELVEMMGSNGCFSVKTWRTNDGFLGDGSFAAGIRATELRFNVDRGTMVATGVSEELFEIVRTFFLAVNDDTGWDAATDIIDRALAEVAEGTAIAGDRPVAAIETSRDLLDDLDEVLESEPVPAAKVIGALRTLAPAWQPYKDLTVPSLVVQLAASGIKVPSTKNKWPVDPVTVRDALQRVATADLDGDDQG